MIIDENKKMLVLRFSEFKDHNFIQEHKKLLKKYGEVWILKLGKTISSKTLKMILSESEGLILKGPKISGGKYYYCHINEAKNGKCDTEMIYPEYYKNLVEEFYWYSLDGTWIKVDEIEELDADIVHRLKLVSNNRCLDEVLSQTRTTILYAYLSNKNT